MRVQKAIYLAQAVGINLGYQYSWYLKGPYSTSLTQDYFKYHEFADAGDESYKEMELNEKLAALIPKTRKVLEMPEALRVEKATWDETLASLHFLLKVSKYDLNKAKEYLKKVKPHIANYIDEGIAHLRHEEMIV